MSESKSEMYLSGQIYKLDARLQQIQRRDADGELTPKAKHLKWEIAAYTAMLEQEWDRANERQDEERFRRR